jgi:glutamate-1-semialdehyde 2,1-aminomutase
MCNHPFFSVDDWFMATTEMSNGIPKSAVQQTIRFDYNDLKSLGSLFADHPDSIAAVIMEAATTLAEPDPGFLEGVRALCDRHGAVLIFDEIITGFRWSVHGAQTVYGVTPDLSCWGKALGNGFPISALAGRRELMELGGLNTDQDRVFLLSTTYGAETAGLAAFRAVVQAYRDSDPIGTMEASGRRLADGINEISGELGLGDYFQVLGRPSCLVFVTRDAQGRPSQAFRTLFLQEVLRRGVLGQSFVVSAAHTAAEIDETIDMVGQALRVYERAIDAGSTDGLLAGGPVAPALRRLAHPRRIS